LKENKNIREVGPQVDIRPFLSISDVLVLPTYREGLPTVLMEAAAMDVPVIASDIIGCNNVVVANENGVFVTSKDEKSLMEKMELMYNNTDLRHSIQSVTRKSIAERFEQEKVWEALLEKYSNPQ
jgi:glycosyltransferase involved in cell wall biosynthesis